MYIMTYCSILYNKRNFTNLIVKIKELKTFFDNQTKPSKINDIKSWQADSLPKYKINYQLLWSSDW